MEVEKFHPEINKVYFINRYCLFQILSGRGSIQVDFKNYFDWQDKAIYLENGQYIKFLSDDFEVRKIEFPNEAIFRNKEVRVLFKHLISLGYINFKECEDCKKYLDKTVFSAQSVDIIDISTKQWYWENPFGANKDEYQLIFDIKDVIDSQYSKQLSTEALCSLINENGYQLQSLVKDKIGLSIKNLFQNKRLIESKKEIAFTDKSIQEITYDMGYKDPSYFNRVFKNETGQSPLQFRKNFDYTERDRFSQDLIGLLRNYHQTERSLEFYASEMHLSIKNLSKKVREKMNTSLGQLIRMEIIHSAKQMLSEGASVQETAFKLGFEEAHHFSAFFKHYTSQNPASFKKYHL